ncbi:MAG TPA: hypothetical protein VFI73_00715 [Candidatus Nitrosopolaris sp.]|nr:hypothetical protein [Candidatus Nitrosopolaris sp.]
MLDTIEIKEISDIEETIKKMVQTYTVKNCALEFSYRLLLPRGEALITHSKRIGRLTRAEFLLSLRTKKLKPNLMEIRYVHDEHHYGWILVEPTVYDDALAAQHRAKKG